MDGTGEEDPRQIAAENEQSEAILNLLHSGLLGRGSPNASSPLNWSNIASNSPRDRGPGASIPGSGRSGRANDYGGSSGMGGFGAGGGMPPFGPFGGGSTGSGGSIRFELRSGPNGRTWTVQRGNAPGGRGAGPQDDLPSFQE